MNYETVWTFNTARFAVRLEVAQDYGYQYDGDDEGGETQAALDAGEYVAFDSRVVVTLDGLEIGSDSLGGSVYGVNEMAQFWEAHRDRDAMTRISSIIRAADGGNCSICHYFPGMVASAISDARMFLKTTPRVRSHG
jgi:hypothetical protein